MSNKSEESTKEILVPKDAKDAESSAKRISEIQNALIELDEKEAPKAQSLLQQASALHADPSAGTAKNADGKTESELIAEFNKVSGEIGKKRAKLEEELISLTKKVGAVADNKTLRELAKQRALASQLAVQEPPQDLAKFANPALDKIRSELQKNPLPGGETASIDDGTGGESAAAAAAAAAKKA